MNSKNLIATVEVNIKASLSKVWEALVQPEMIKKYMFDTTVVSEWKKGSAIVWKGNWKGKDYEDKGVILKIIPPTALHYTHYSPLSGEKDVPENYHTVTIDLFENGNQTLVLLTQDHNGTEKDRDHSEKNWAMMLKSLKELLEKADDKDKQ